MRVVQMWCLGARAKASGLLEDQVVIERRFNGPPNSAHGGYACAVAAQFLGWSAEVSLRQPPPLDSPLSVRRDGEGVVLERDGEVVIAGRPAQLDLDLPEPVSLAEAEAAAALCPWLERHPFPSCFGCGFERPPGDGLFEFPGPVSGRPDIWAAVWTPQPSLADDAGDVLPIFTFSALDCPSGAGAISATGATGVFVLGRMTGRVIGTARAGVPHVVMAWPVHVDGRKRYGGAAIFNDGELCGLAESLWIGLRDPDQFDAAEGVRLDA
jgi:hypothetical protein